MNLPFSFTHLPIEGRLKQGGWNLFEAMWMGSDLKGGETEPWPSAGVEATPSHTSMSLWPSPNTSQSTVMARLSQMTLSHLV